MHDCGGCITACYRFSNAHVAIHSKFDSDWWHANHTLPMSKVFVQRLQLKLSITHLRVAQQMILLGQILFVGLSIYLCRTGFHVYLCCAAWLILNCKEEPLILDYTSDCDREKVVKRFCSRAGPHYIFAVQKCQKIDEI